MGAKVVPFAGFEMPINYRSIIEEHNAVRKGAGLFDVSHMGQIFIGGRQTDEFLDHILTNEIAAAAPGSAVYAHMPNDQGGVIDDLIVYKLSRGMNLLVVNASRIEDDWNWIRSQAKNFMVEFTNESDKYGIIALQGPAAARLAEEISPETAAIATFKVKTIVWNHHEIITARTGYTGEDGFEFIAENEVLVPLWETIAKLGQKISPFSPCGLGARDTLRLEAGYPLWGHELNETITPLEASYGWVVKWNKDFIGKKAMENLKTSGLNRKIFGFMGKTAGPIARQGAVIKTPEGKEAGLITSGSFSPTLAKPIALGFLTKNFWGNNDFVLEAGGRALGAQKIKLPFYKRG